MNLGAFAVVVAVARKTRSGEIDSFSGLFQCAPALAVVMGIFLASLAGIPPLGGWFAKLVIVRALVSPGTASGYALAVVVAVNSVIAVFYYFRVLRLMFMEQPVDGDRTPIRVPASITISLVITVAITVVYGIFPAAVTHFTDTVSLRARPLVPTPAEVEVAARIRRRGPVPFDEVVDLALLPPRSRLLHGRRGPGRPGRGLPHQPRGRSALRGRPGPGPGRVVARAGIARPVHRHRGGGRHRQHGARRAGRGPGLRPGAHLRAGRAGRRPPPAPPRPPAAGGSDPGLRRRRPRRGRAGVVRGRGRATGSPTRRPGSARGVPARASGHPGHRCGPGQRAARQPGLRPARAGPVRLERGPRRPGRPHPGRDRRGRPSRRGARARLRPRRTDGRPAGVGRHAGVARSLPAPGLRVGHLRPEPDRARTRRGHPDYALATTAPALSSGHSTRWLRTYRDPRPRRSAARASSDSRTSRARWPSTSWCWPTIPVG